MHHTKNKNYYSNHFYHSLGLVNPPLLGGKSAFLFKLLGSFCDGGLRGASIMANYIYTLRMKVRDYECDLQGIVNNANYQHYIEHTRHEFLLSHGVSFARLHDEGIDCVVARLTMQFKVPLRSGDEFDSRLWIKKEGIRYVFMQDIYRASDQKLCIRAQVDAVCIINGTLADCPQLNEAFAEFFN